MEHYLARSSAQVVLDDYVDEEDKEKEQLLKDLLKKLKKDDSADKKGIKATGGGSYKPLLDDVGSQMLAIMGDQIQPLHNNCDSASSYYGHYQEQSSVGDANKDHTFEEPTEGAVVFAEQGKHIYVDASHGASSTETNTKSNIIKKRRISHTVTSEGMKLKPRLQKKNLKQKNTSAEDLRKEYYSKKLECAIIEKKSRLVELKINYKRLQLLNIEIKNKNLN